MEISDKLSLADYLWIRKLRNENCNLMTGDTTRVSVFRQILFYLRKPANIHLYIVRSKGQRAGYLLLREFAPGCAYITECIVPACQSLGLGSRMVEFAKKRVTTLIAYIQQTNVPSIRLHTRNGFVLESEQNGVLRYVWSRSTA